MEGQCAADTAGKGRRQGPCGASGGGGGACRQLVPTPLLFLAARQYWQQAAAAFNAHNPTSLLTYVPLPAG